jgi:hypothetical protein
MPVSRLPRIASDMLTSRVTWGGSQNFLGARWVEWAVSRSPRAARERVALRFLPDQDVLTARRTRATVRGIVMTTYCDCL